MDEFIVFYIHVYIMYLYRQTLRMLCLLAFEFVMCWLMKEGEKFKKKGSIALKQKFDRKDV